MLEFHELHEAVGTIGRAFEYYAASGEIDRAVAVAEVPFIGPPENEPVWLASSPERWR